MEEEDEPDIEAIDVDLKEGAHDKGVEVAYVGLAEGLKEIAEGDREGEGGYHSELVV